MGKRDFGMFLFNIDFERIVHYYGHPSGTHLKLKSREISSMHNIRFNCPIVLKLCCITAMIFGFSCCRFGRIFKSCWVQFTFSKYVTFLGLFYCPACRTTLVATRFRVAVICPIIQVPHCIRVFFYFV